MCMPPFNPTKCSSSATRKVAFGVDLEDLERILHDRLDAVGPHRVPCCGTPSCCPTTTVRFGSGIAVAKGIASRLERRTLEAYDKGFEAGVAFAVADEARRSEPWRKVVERDREGRIIAITG